MTWTTKDPKEEGYYWLRRPGNGENRWLTEIVRFYKITNTDKGHVVFMGYEEWLNIYELGKERWWAGPLKEPEIKE